MWRGAAPCVTGMQNGNIRKALLNRESARAFFARLRYPSLHAGGGMREKMEEAQSASAPLFYLSFDKGVTLEP